MRRYGSPNVTRLIDLGGQVVEPVPFDKRDRFTHYRGLHLGSVCLNYFRGLPTLNAAGSTAAHFSTSYKYAVGIAHSQAEASVRHTRQFSPADAAELSRLSGLDVKGIALPSVVVALSPELTDMLEPGEMEGEVYEGYLLTTDVDPFSQEFLRTVLPD